MDFSPREESAPCCGARPWSVDRWGRLLAGSGVLLFGALGFVHHSGWFAGTVLIAFNLVLTSLTDHCPLREALLRLGAREREDLFMPGGLPRNRSR